MRNVVRALLFLGLAGFTVGVGCGPSLIGTVTPTEGNTITTFSFGIAVQIGATADPGTLNVKLNGQDITGQLTGGPPNYAATINPGSPLLDSNTLVVHVEEPNSGGLGHPLGANKTVNFQYLPPKARANVVSNQADCPTGPLAHCRPGDFMLANTDARFVIQKAAQRELHFTGTFGGNLIDAETVVGGVPQGRDNFFEFQPMVNIEQAINAQTVEIVNDGQDGTTAIVRSCGPDDLLDDINPSSQVVELGAHFPINVNDVDYDVIGCTEYRLNPQTRTVEVVTTVDNFSLDDYGLFPGDFMNASGELEQWTPMALATPMKDVGVGEMLTNFGIRAMGFYGFKEAEGVDYALIQPSPPEVPISSSSFTTSGVSFIAHGNTIPSILLGGAPNFTVLAGEMNSFRRWFEVGDGSAGNAIESLVDVMGLANGTLRGCVRESVTNAPIVGARVAARDIVTSPPATFKQSRNVVRSHYVTDATGCYEGRVPTGTYQVAAGKEGYPYEGGLSTPTNHAVTIASGGTVVQDIVLPQAGRLHVNAVDHNNAPVPARVGVVGFDPSPEVTLTTSAISGNDTKTQLFYDRTVDALPTALSRTEYSNAAGVVDIALEPGTYQVAVSRGTEYSLYTEQVTITAANTTTVNAQIAPVLDTTGAISADYHVHMIDSPDSRISRKNRIESFAGEGVDDIIATDHAAVTDLDGQIAALGFASFVNSTPGEEITSFDYGHFNAYPQGQDPSQPQTQGATDHSGAAPPGRDFPAYGYYNLSPAQIEAAAIGKPQNAGKETVVQINHIDSHFNPLRIDTSQTPPTSVLDGNAFDLDSGDPLSANPLFFRLDPNITNFYHHFAGLELWNGFTTAHQNQFLLERIGIWMNLLNQGLPTTAISDTDTHKFHNLESGGARSWTPSSTDAPAGVVDVEIARAVRAGKMVGGQGIYVQTRLVTTDGSRTASLTGLVPAGTQSGTLQAGTLVTVTNGAVNLEIRVQAPTWAPYDRIQIYRNASTQVARRNPPVTGTPTLFTAVPTTTLNAGTDFSVATVAVNGSQRFETNKAVSLTGLAADEWIVVIVKGTQGVSAPMFPVMTDGVSLTQNPTLAELSTVTAAENGIRALGTTNALYVDVDQNGVFDAPGVTVVP